MLTARAITRPKTAIEMSDCTPIAPGTSGITSVGLKAKPFATTAVALGLAACTAVAVLTLPRI